MKSSIMNQRTLPVWKRRTAWLGLIPTAAILCLAAMPLAQSGEPTMGSGGADPEGSWLASITTPDGKTWEVPMSYCAGGAMVVSDPSIFPGMATAYHGTWMQTGRREFTFTMVGFIYNEVIDELPKGMSKIVIKETNMIETNGDSYSGSGSLELYGPDGAQVEYRPVVPSHAVRIKAE